MAVSTKTLYETDFVEWTARTAELLRERRFEELDLELLVEEVEELGLDWKHAVHSQLTRLLMHLIKLRIQPDRSSASWRASIVSARSEIAIYIEDAPSLRRYAERTLSRAFHAAVKSAIEETGIKPKRGTLPVDCPYS